MTYPDQTASGDKAAVPNQEVKREIIELVKMVVLFLLLFMFLKTFVVEGYEVQGPSMIPTLEDRERILVLKLPLKLSHLPLLRGLEPLQPGDIVVFESDVEPNKRYIKRVIAKGPARPGENTVNARAEDTHGTSDTVAVEFDRGTIYVNHHKIDEPYLVPEEARSPERSKAVLGAGEFYVLGDHRSVSKDSRNFGPIDEEQLIGKAVFRFWPLSKIGLL